MRKLGISFLRQKNTGKFGEEGSNVRIEDQKNGRFKENMGMKNSRKEEYRRRTCITEAKGEGIQDVDNV